MTQFTTTREARDPSRQEQERPEPGLVRICTEAGPCFDRLPVGEAPQVLGRGQAVGGLAIDDPDVSRRHVEVSFAHGRWRFADLGSRNGTFVDGTPVDEEDPEVIPQPRLLRVGSSIFLPVDDLRAYAAGVSVGRDGLVIGPLLRQAWDSIEAAGRAGTALVVTGESGTGKEQAARAYHAASPRAAGPFVAVNCAAIPAGVAERVLFGARRGAYSGAAADADGHFQAAHGGTLFLDEVGELEMAVQGKLLRALEVSEIIPLGAARAIAVDVRVVAATSKSLSMAAAAGGFRSDLYYRIGRAQVMLPPLRRRLEEIPHLVAGALLDDGAAAPLAGAAFFEACLLRPWPGNVRELHSEVRRAASEARRLGAALLGARDLAPTAGLPLGETAEEPAPRGGIPERAVIEAALKAEHGNVVRTARALGLHRNTLRRWLLRNGVDPRAYGGEEA